jgi:glutathione S-transferase
MATANTFVAGALALSPGSGAVPIVVALVFVVHTWMGILVGIARRRYGVPYPTMYAVPGTPRHYAPTKDKSEAGGLGGATAASALTGAPQAELITAEEAYAFNCVQRGHQNTVENLPAVLAMLLVCWLTFPAYAGGCGAIWVAGRVLYMLGYSRGAETRMWGAIAYVGLFGLLALTIASGVFLFQQKAAY